jgi:hypothetical protein
MTGSACQDPDSPDSLGDCTEQSRDTCSGLAVDSGMDGQLMIAAVTPIGTRLSQISHGLDGRYRTRASIPDTGQDADMRLRIAEDCLDRLH